MPNAMASLIGKILQLYILHLRYINIYVGALTLYVGAAPHIYSILRCIDILFHLLIHIYNE